MKTRVTVRLAPSLKRAAVEFAAREGFIDQKET